MYAFIDDRYADLPVGQCCQAMKVSRSALFAWRQQRANPSTTTLEDVDLGELIVKIHNQSIGTYGRLRITAELQLGLGRQVNYERIGRLMREHNLVG